MGDKMIGSFVVYLVVSTLIACLLRLAVPLASASAAPAASFGRIFQLGATAGVLACSFSFIPNALWFGAYKRTIVASVFDGIACGLATGAIFAWGWK